MRVHALNNLGTVEADSGDEEEGWRLLEESLRAFAGRRPPRARGARVHQPRVAGRPSSTTTCVPGPICPLGLRYCLERDLDAWALYMRGLAGTQPARPG